MTDVPHLEPGRWAEANRLLVAKALGELTHERLLRPQPVADGYVVRGDDERVEYRFRARRFALDHWRVDPASITCSRGDIDALRLVHDLAGTLGLDGERLGIYLEEITSTLASLAFKLGRPPVTPDAGFQAIEAGMTEGHPCFVANSGRLGFSAADFARYAPETARPVRLEWVAARREHAAFSHAHDTSYAELLEAELGPETLARFGARVDLDAHVLLPVHPWQWENRLAVTFAGDVATGRLVHLGPGDDEHVAQQSIRTFFNVTRPDRHYVKTALSVVNMGFVRGLSAKYMAGTPAINDWVAQLVASDPALDGFSVLRECAAAGYVSPAYAGVDGPYAKMLAALWRESPVPRLAPGERLATMASLLHVDRDGRSFAAGLIERSGVGAETWLRAYLDAYLRPLLHLFYAYDLVFMPHGENLILVLDEHVPRRVFLKDIAEEVVLMDPDRPLPPEVERIRADVPDDLKALSLLTDVVDCFFRFLGPILDEAGALPEDRFWAGVAACIADYQAAHPELRERFTEHDLFAGEFALSCLNRLQLRDSRQMVDLQDPAGSLQIVGTLATPLAQAAVATPLKNV